MRPYISTTSKDEAQMLEQIGLSSLDELFCDIPKDLRLSRELDLPKGKSELEVARLVSALSKKNTPTNELVCFLGAGAYDHYIPSVVKHLASRSEFYTAYTPYQPEISQGTLQAIFEFQTMITELTGMEASNASMYDISTAAAEAMIMMCDKGKNKKIMISKTISRETIKVLSSYANTLGIEIVLIPEQNGTTDLDFIKANLDKSYSGIILQNPNFYGIVEDYSGVKDILDANKAFMTLCVGNPISLSVLKTPASYGADIVVGEGQAFGNSLNYGGPYLGFIGAKDKLLRNLPGRIVGETTDIDGKRAFVLTLQAREQHIRRHKASSNICSNQALNALMATIYLSTMGKAGLVEVANQCISKAHYLASKLKEAGYKLVYEKPFFNEFVVDISKDVTEINHKLLSMGILGGYDLGQEDNDQYGHMLLCVTEKRTKEEMDNFVQALGEVK